MKNLLKFQILFEIFNSRLPIKMRITTNTSIFNIIFNDKFRPGMIDIFKISLKITGVAPVKYSHF